MGFIYRYHHYLIVAQILMKYLFVCVLAWCLVFHSSSWEFNNPYREIVRNEQSIHYLDQLIDHYDYTSTSTWKQRYYLFDQYYKPGGTVILYICGEAECHGISDSSWTAQIAKETQGMVLSLEHRFYGKSLPFGADSLSFQNLKYLTAEQALKDLAYFLQAVVQKGLHQVKPSNPWITIGGSYPGALSAWFRSKYPHLTVGSLASSGVVLAVENFKDFDEQIYTSSQKSGDYCTQAIQSVTDYVEKQVTSERAAQFQAQFKAQKLNAREFLFYWSDVIVFQIQYGVRSEFCESLKSKTLEEIFTVVKALAIKVSPVDYGSYYLGNATYAMEDGRGARSWYYQSCTQFSYFQTFSNKHPMRSSMLTIDFYRAWCEDIFGRGVWPYVDRVNNEFGGLHIKATNLIMTNGGEDPWKWASLQSGTKTVTSKVIDCDDCAHCVDLRAPKTSDSNKLTSVRTLQLDSIKEWISVQSVPKVTSY